MLAPVSKVEEFFERHQFSTRYLLCASDCETMSIRELLELCDMGPDCLLDLKLGYTRGQGHAELRNEIAATYVNVAADQVIALASPMEGIYVAFRAVLEEGDHVIVQWPTFSPLLDLPRLVGANITLWKMRARPGRWALDLDELADLLQPNTRLIVTTFPDNPTGFAPGDDFLRRLAALAHRVGAWIFSDEIFRGVGPTDHQTHSLADLYPRSLTLGGLSKAFGLPGLRAGWLAVPDPSLREVVLNWRAYTSQCSAAPAELLATVALRNRAKLLARSRRLVAENHRLASDFCARHADRFIYRAPLGGTTMLTELDSPGATELCSRLVRDASVMLLPSSCFEMEDRFVRFGFGRRDFGEGLLKLEQYMYA